MPVWMHSDSDADTDIVAVVVVVVVIVGFYGFMNASTKRHHSFMNAVLKGS